MHVLDINRCCFCWLGFFGFFPLLFFCPLLILFFALKHCSMDFIWIKVSSVFSVVRAGLYCCGCLWQHHPEGSIIPDTCLAFSGFAWVLELGSRCPSMVERKGEDFSQSLCEHMASLLSPTHLLWPHWPASSPQNQLPQLLPVLWIAENWVCRVKAEDMISKFPFTVVFTFVSAAWLTRRTLSFLASSHLLSPSLALACTEQPSKKRSSAVDKNPGIFFVQISKESPLRMFT